jgi:hypothetical protein
MGHYFGTMEYVNIDCCFSHCPATMWFVAEKCKQRGRDRDLYADWIILVKEQFSFRITGFLIFIHRPEF